VTDRAVTVVVPTRNRRSVLAMTLGTLVAQRDVEVRVVVIDEASSDDTPAYLAAVAGDSITVVRHDEPRGLAAARNAGLERAETRWVAFCDDDDIWAPDKLAAQLDAMAALPDARWSCTGTVSIDAALQVIGFHRPPPSGDARDLLRVTNVIPGGGSSIVVDTALAKELGGYDAWAIGCEDYDMHCRVSKETVLAAVDRPLVGYRVWAGSMSTNVERMRTGHLRTLERHRGDLDPALARPGDLHAEQYWARFHLRNGDRRRALVAYLQIAARYRLPGQLAYAMWGAVDPRGADRHQASLERRAVPPAWEADARTWLDQVEVLEPLQSA
jgi:glycosyltransferase involved in cell wall biosynthesis